MSRTVTAFFDSREEAEAAKTRLQSSSIDADRIRIIDQSSSSTSSESTGESKGFFAALGDLFMPDEDAYAYQEGVNRGGFLLCAQVDEDEADQAIRLLEESNSVDFDERERGWRNEGWTGWTGERDSRFGSTTGTTGGQSYAEGTTTGAGQTVAEERIPLVEEELRVGKREVERGGARVRSYVRETPVHEQVSLRDEHVSVERRPVDERIDPSELQSGDFLRDREIDMTETHEEVVVGKEARVTEEVVVRKTADERVEQVDDTVRRTEVDVEEGGTRPAFGFDDDRTTSETERTHFERTDFERSSTDPTRRP